MTKFFKKISIIILIFLLALFSFYCDNHLNDNFNFMQTGEYNKNSGKAYPFKNYENSANLSFEELRDLKKSVIEFYGVSTSHKYDILLVGSYYFGIVKDEKGRYSYYYDSELKKNGLFEVQGYNGYEDLKYVYIDEDGYLVKNYFLQDYLIKGRKRSYYIDENFNVVSNYDIKFDNNTNSNKKIMNIDDVYHFGKDRYLTSRKHKDTDGKVITIKGEWFKNENDVWQYYNVNDYIEKNSIISNNNNYFYVDEKGLIVKDYYLQNFYDGEVYSDYYFDKDGKKATSYKGGGMNIIFIDKNTNSNIKIDSSYVLYIDNRVGRVSRKVKTKTKNSDNNIDETNKEIEVLEKEDNDINFESEKTKKRIIDNKNVSRKNQISDKMFKFLISDEMKKDLNGMKLKTYLATEQGEPVLSKPNDFVGIIAKVIVDIDNDSLNELLVFEIDSNKKIYLKLYKEFIDEIKFICKEELETPEFINFVFSQNVYMKKIDNEYRIYVELVDSGNYSVDRQYVNHTYYVYDNKKFQRKYIAGYNGGSADYYRANEYYNDFINAGISVENFDEGLLNRENDFENIDYYSYDKNLIRIYEFKREFDEESEDLFNAKNYFTIINVFNNFNNDYIYIY